MIFRVGAEMHVIFMDYFREKFLKFNKYILEKSKV